MLLLFYCKNGILLLWKVHIYYLLYYFSMIRYKHNTKYTFQTYFCIICINIFHTYFIIQWNICKPSPGVINWYYPYVGNYPNVTLSVINEQTRRHPEPLKVTRLCFAFRLLRNLYTCETIQWVLPMTLSKYSYLFCFIFCFDLVFICKLSLELKNCIILQKYF
jgi:hypothetical protein